MTDFLEYIRHRRARILKELKELEAAERVFLKSGARAITNQGQLSLPSKQRAKPQIQQSVLMVLEEVAPDGLTALEILNRLNSVWWGGNLKRTSLSPQLSRLRKQKKIDNVRGVWKLTYETTPTEEPDGVF